MSNKILITTLSTIVAMGLGSSAMADAASDSLTMQNTMQTTLTKAMPGGFEKCYGIAAAAKNDCASGTEACAGQSKLSGAKDAWLGVPMGTCERIVGGSLTEGPAA